MCFSCFGAISVVWFTSEINLNLCIALEGGHIAYNSMFSNRHHTRFVCLWHCKHYHNSCCGRAETPWPALVPRETCLIVPILTWDDSRLCYVGRTQLADLPSIAISQGEVHSFGALAAWSHGLSVMRHVAWHSPHVSLSSCGIFPAVIPVERVIHKGLCSFAGLKFCM